MRILCTGDIHIGRRSSRLPEGADARGVTCAGVWQRIVDLAVERRVDVVALTGDVVDRDNRFFEALGPLEQGLARLADSGIDTVAVAGNHDFDVLPRLAANLDRPRFHVLGAGGAWQRVMIERDDHPVLAVDGWSFPAQHVKDDPLESYDLPAAGGVPLLGLMHCDVDNAASPYAPVRLAELERQPVACWLLGHIHRPTRHTRAGVPPILYPGCPQPMGPDETGPHGPWLLELDAGGQVTAEHVPLATVRYDSVDVPLEGAETTAELESALVDAVAGHLQQVAESAPGPLAWLCCRPRFTGRTRLHGRLRDELPPLLQDFQLQRGEIAAVTESPEFQTRPAVDLNQLATGRHPLAALAGLVLALEQGHSERYAAVIRRAQQRMNAAYRSTSYADLRTDADGDGPPTTDEARGALLRQGRALLEQLIAQKEEA